VSHEQVTPCISNNKMRAASSGRSDLVQSGLRQFRARKKRLANSLSLVPYQLLLGHGRYVWLVYSSRKRINRSFFSRLATWVPPGSWPVRLCQRFCRKVQPDDPLHRVPPDLHRRKNWPKHRPFSEQV